MFSQLVYTRSYSCRLLNKNGELKNMSGFGVRSFSPSLYQQLTTNQLTKLDTKLYIRSKNESKNHLGFFESFDYVSINDYIAMFSMQAPYINENGRGGNYIKHAYIGEIDELPIKYMNSKLYPYCSLSEDEMLKSDELNELLTDVDLIAEATITKDDALAFYNNHKETVRKLISFIIVQKSLPEGQRKVVIIKDTPDNVLKYIACVIYALPLAFAKQVSFSTNMEIDRNKPATYLYSEDESGNYFPLRMNDENLIQKCVYDIIGIHPQGNGAKNFKAIENAPYVLIENDNLNIDVNMNNVYLDTVCQYKDFMHDFDYILNYYQDYSIKDLYQLYDIFVYLFEEHVNEENWKYLELIDKLEMLDHYLIKDSRIENVLYTKSIYNHYFDSLMSYDYKNNLKLLRRILAVAYKFDEGIVLEIYQRISKIIEESMSPRKHLYQGLNVLLNFIYTDNKIIDFVLGRFFEESKVSKSSYISSIEEMDEDYTDYILVYLDMYNHFLNYQGLTVEMFKAHNGWYNLLFHLYRLILQEGNVDDVIELVKVYDDSIMNLLMLEFAKRLGSKQIATKNWVKVYANGISTQELIPTCKKMVSAGIDSTTVELLLVTYLESRNQIDKTVFKCFDYLNTTVKNNNLGENFFTTYLQVAKNTDNSTKDIIQLIDYIETIHINKSIKMNIIREIESFVSIQPNNRDETVLLKKYIELIENYGLESRKLNTYRLLKDVELVDSNELLHKFIGRYKNLDFDVNDLDSRTIINYSKSLVPYIKSGKEFIMVCLLLVNENNQLKKVSIQSSYKEVTLRTKKDLVAIHTIVDLYTKEKMCKRIVNTSYYDQIIQIIEPDKLPLLAASYKKELWDEYIDKTNNKVAVSLQEEIETYNEENRKSPLDKVNNLFSRFKKR